MVRATALEPILEPELPIVDAHHHLWVQTESALNALEQRDAVSIRALAPTFRRHARYVLEEFLKDTGSGHSVRASVHVDAHTMYRTTGPEALKSVGEVEFVNGIAAMSASGAFGNTRICAGIVGGVDLTLGDAVEEVLTKHIQSAGARYRGVRCPGIVHDEDPSIRSKVSVSAATPRA